MLALDETQLCLMVKKLFLNPSHQVASTAELWLRNNNLMHKKYLTWISNLGSKIDRMLLWLASLTTRTHLNIIHVNGVWTTRMAGIPDLQDPSIAVTLGGFLVVTEAATDAKKKKKIDNLDNFSDPRQVCQNFVPSPIVLNQLVQDLQSQCDDIGLVPFGESTPLYVLLAEFVRLSIAEYHPQLVAWLQHFRSSLNPVHH